MKSERSFLKKNRLYNIAMPFWILWLIPQAFLITIPINLIVDSIVLYATLKFLNIEEPFKIYRSRILSVFSIGYLSDIVGSIYMIAWMLLLKKTDINFYISPFKSPLSFLIVLSAIAISGILIYMLNYKILKKTIKKDARTIAIIIAIFTAPYFFLLPPL